MNQCFNKNIMEWQEFPEYDLLYTDPPWGIRMVKWFNNLYKKDAGVEPTDTFSEIFHKLASCAQTNKPLIIEYQVKEFEMVVAIMQEHGHTYTGATQRLQSMGRPFLILAFNCHIEFEENTNGFDLVTEACIKLNAKTVFDPFAGIGKTAKAVMKAGAEYIGSEYNPQRYKKLKTVMGCHENI